MRIYLGCHDLSSPFRGKVFIEAHGPTIKQILRGGNCLSLIGGLLTAYFLGSGMTLFVWLVAE